MSRKPFAALVVALLLAVFGLAGNVKAQEGIEGIETPAPIEPLITPESFPTAEVPSQLDLPATAEPIPPTPFVMPEATPSPTPAPELPPVIWPYAGVLDVDFWITQGDHGKSYGHSAVDVTGGNGTPIIAMVNGTVTGGGINDNGDPLLDQWGNPFVEITDDQGQRRHVVMHGIYSVRIGQKVVQGEVIGSESNQGYTLDMYGNSCAGRDCGYHTHWAVFDIATGAPVYPETLLPGAASETIAPQEQPAPVEETQAPQDMALSRVLTIFAVAIVVIFVVGMLWHSRPIRWLLGKVIWFVWFTIAFGYLVIPFDLRDGPLDDIAVIAVTYVLNKLSQRFINRLMSWRNRDDSPEARELRQVQSELKFLRFAVGVMTLALGLATYLPLEWLSFTTQAESENTSGRVPVYTDVVLVNDEVISWLQELRFYDNRVFANIVERSRWMRGADGRRVETDGVVLPWQLPVATYFGETPSSDGSGAYVAYWMAPSEEAPSYVPQDKILEVDPRTPGPWGWQNCINAFESTYPGDAYIERRALMHAGLEKIANDPEVQTLWPGTTPDQLHCSRSGAIGRGQTMLFHFADGKLAGDLGNFNVWTNPATVAEVTIRHHAACWARTPDIASCVTDYLGSYDGPYVITVVGNANRLESGYTERFGIDPIAVQTETEELPEATITPDPDGTATSPITITVDAESEFPTVSITNKTLPKVQVGEINVYSTLIIEMIADMRADETPSEFDAWLLPKLEIYAGFAYLITPKEWVASNPILAEIVGGTPTISMQEASVTLYLHNLSLDRQSNDFTADNIRWFLVKLAGEERDYLEGEAIDWDQLRADEIRGKFILQASKEWSLLENLSSFEATRMVGGRSGAGASELATTLRMLAAQIDGVQVVCGHCGEEYAPLLGSDVPPEMAVLIDPEASGADLILRSDRERTFEFTIEDSKLTIWVSRVIGE